MFACWRKTMVDTGFNPDFMDMLSDDLTAIYTIDFSDNIGMFEAFYKS